MKIGIIGSGDVGQVIAKGLLSEGGHQVWLSTRSTDSDKATQLKNDIAGATICDFATAASEGEIIFICVKWNGMEESLNLAGKDNFNGKIVIDTSNVLKMTDGVMVHAGGEVSAAERVQAWLTNSRVVKAFNTVGAATMYKPDFNGQIPTMFIAGDDLEAKQKVKEIIGHFGWETLDAGNLIAARSLEPMAPLWINYSMATKSPHHAFKML